ncbi:MAG: energy transducer TonB [Bacteroidaceae bacterium]|nr:energy transducer TonB [Bacteroidaceae bacterium]
MLEVKKAPVADLEGKKTTGLLMGFIFILAIMFVAFEWTRHDVIDTGEIIEAPMLNFEEEIIPITMQEKLVAPVPVEAKAITETIEIVEDDAEIEETMIMSDEDMGEVVEIQNIENVVVEEPEKEEEIFQVVENMPEFPGGTAELMKYLQKNIKYPAISQENGVQGRVIVQFVVNRDGSIVEPTVIRSVDPYLDKEALRVVSTMPKWKPGEQRGKPVRVKFTLPVQFRLQ